MDNSIWAWSSKQNQTIHKWCIMHSIKKGQVKETKQHLQCENPNKETKHRTKWSWSWPLYRWRGLWGAPSGKTGRWRSSISWPILARPSARFGHFATQAPSTIQKHLGDLRDAETTQAPSWVKAVRMCFATPSGPTQEWESTAREGKLPHIWWPWWPSRHRKATLLSFPLCSWDYSSQGGGCRTFT